MHSVSSRLYEILPQRIQQWQQSPCIAEEQGKKQLERIRRDQQNARMRLTDMEKRFHELEGIIAKAKQQVVQQDEEVSHFRISLLATAVFIQWGQSSSAREMFCPFKSALKSFSGFLGETLL